jgi:ABC-type maltose transport system permease subunit
MYNVTCNHFVIENLFPLQMFVCELCLLNRVILVICGLFEVLGTLRQIMLSYLVYMYSRLRSLGRGQIHVGPIIREVLPHVIFVIATQMVFNTTLQRHQDQRESLRFANSC